MTNWKTTASGIGTILAIVSDTIAKIVRGEPVDILTVVTGLAAGIGLIMAKDHNVTGGTIQQ